MKVIEAGYEIMSNLDGMEVLKFIEKCGRTCYKSEDRITEDSCKSFVNSITRSGHHSVLEHISFTVKFIISRATSHQLVRHRLMSVSQESQRYCNYSLDKFNNELVFIRPTKLEEGPFYIDDEITAYGAWYKSMEAAEKYYFKMIELGCPPQVARECLPNSSKTEVIITANLREWRHMFIVRTCSGADDGIKYIMTKLLDNVKKVIPVVFDDIKVG